MSTATWSIRRRLLSWLLISLLLVCMVLLVMNYFQARNAADAAYDRLLAASAQAIAERVIVSAGELEIDLPYVALDMLASTAQDRVFYQISSPEWGFVTGYEDLPPPPEKASLSGSADFYYNVMYRGEPVRIAMLSRPLAPWGLQGSFQVQIAQTLGERNRLTWELVLASALRLLAVVVLAAAITWFGVRKGLESLIHLQQLIRTRSPQDLRPITQVVPLEVRDLVDAINQLMARLEANLATMQRFIADASHQLRTPLAGLQAQVEMLLREQDPPAHSKPLQKLLAATHRTSHLADQLLSLARASPESGALTLVPIDLTALAKTVTREAVPRAIVRQMDLGFEGEGPLIVHGDPLLLQELLKNLIDNALRYCPAQSHITIRTARTAVGEALLEVEDDGPGIPPGESARVLERFYRIPGAPGDGSGLGLAIVSEIADRHGAVMALDSGAAGRGLRVRLVFPKAVPLADPETTTNPNLEGAY